MILSQPAQIENPKFLCCFGRLQMHVVKATTIIGYFELTIALLVTVVTVALLVAGETRLALEIFGIETTEAQERLELYIGAIIFGIGLQFIIVFFLIGGAKTERKIWLIPFLVVTAIAVASFVLRILQTFLLATQHPTKWIPALFTVALGLGVQIWFFVIVLRCYQCISNKQRSMTYMTSGQSQITASYPCHPQTYMSPQPGAAVPVYYHPEPTVMYARQPSPPPYNSLPMKEYQ